MPAGDNPRAVVLSDLDGDGHLDVVAANSGSDDEAVGLETGLASAAQGLPLAAWSFDA